MSHTDKNGDGAKGKGVGGCGGNLLQHNLSSDRGVRGMADIVREHLVGVRSAVTAYAAIRRHQTAR